MSWCAEFEFRVTQEGVREIIAMLKAAGADASVVTAVGRQGIDDFVKEDSDL